jgi:hypothetical protein
LIHRENLRDLADKHRLESSKIEAKYKKDILDARKKCVDKIKNARQQRKADFIKARMKKLTAKKELKNKLSQSATCGKIATGEI